MTTAAAPARPAPIPPKHELTGGELRQIPLTELVESPWNPRKHFDPAKLAEMVDSLKKGQLAPIIVRPWKNTQGSYKVASPYFEIGAGHRRFRAAPAAGLTSLLAIVRDLDDVAFLELLTIENKQRDDVEPLDEAEGFKLLMQKAGYDVAKLAARIGLSKEYVYARLKLLQLVPEARKYLEQRVITAGHAILLARLSPSEQKKVMGNPARGGAYGRISGLFEGEDSDSASDQTNLALRDGIKVRSVRELESYINEHVRQKPEEIDGFFFPETAKALTQAKEEELKVVHITHDFLAKEDVRRADKQRVFGSASWKHAGGKKGKSCEYAALGVVVAGQDRGQSFMVCVRRDKCTTHWPKPKRARASASSSRNSSSSNEDYWEQQRKRQAQEQARRDAINARWTVAGPTLLDALAKAMKKLPAGAGSPIGKYLINETEALPYDTGTARKYLPIGTTAEELVRHIVFAHVAGDIDEPYDGGKQAIESFRMFGINATKILDEVAPKPKAEKKAATKKTKKGSRT